MSVSDDEPPAPPPVNRSAPARRRRPKSSGSGLRAELLRGGAGTFALQIGSAGLTVGSAVLLARLLGAEEYGAYTFAIAITGLLGLPATLGLPELAVREIAKHRAREEWAHVRGFVRWAIRTVAIASVSVAVIAAFAFGSGAAPAETRTAVLLALPIVPLVTGVRLAGAILRGLRQVVLGQVNETVVRPAAVILAVLVAYAIAGEALDAGHAALAHVAAVAVTLAVAIAMVAPRFPERALVVSPALNARGWVVAGLPMLFIGAMHVIILNTDVVMLGALESAESAGIYRVASRGSQTVVFVLSAAGAVLQPVVASLYARGEVARLQRILTRSVRLVVLVSLPIALTLIVFGDPLIRFVFGGEFEEGGSALAILAGGQLVNAAVGSAGLLLTMTGHERETAVGLAVGAVGNVVLNAALIPPFGLEGAAVATASSILVWNLILVVRARRVLGIDTTILGGLVAKRAGAGHGGT